MSAFFEETDSTAIPVDNKFRRSVKQLIAKKPGLLRFMECHSPLVATIIESSKPSNGGPKSFDGLWSSSLTDSSLRGLPDREIVSMYERINFAADMLAVSCLPMIMDGDTGGSPEQLAATVRRAERNSISALVIEDKAGGKQNSLLADSSVHILADEGSFAEKIEAAVRARTTDDFMVVARLEGLVVGTSHEDVVRRADRFISAGADAILVHSKAQQPDEVLAVGECISRRHPEIPLIAVPTTYPSVADQDLLGAGYRIVIYANHMLRASVRAMSEVGQAVLSTNSLQAAEPYCVPVEDLLYFSEAGQ